MYYNSIYSQLFNFIPRYRFEKNRKKVRRDRYCKHFTAMAEECGLNPKMVLAELDSLAAKLPDIADKLDRE